MADALRRQGIPVTLTLIPDGEYEAAIREGRADLYRAGWMADDPDPENFLALFLSGASWNWGGYSNPEYDRLFEELSRESETTRRIQLARRMERFLSQPFLVAEVFTGKSGEITPLEDTIRSFEEIADGKWDHLPEQAFMYVGAIEQAAEQAEKMAKVK